MIFKSILALSTMFSALSCQNASLDIAGEKTVRFNAVNVETKTVFGNADGSTYPTLWTTNQQVALSLNYCSKVVSDVSPSADQKSASFEATLTPSSGTSSYTYYAVSPASAVSNIYSNYSDWTMTFPTEQTPTSDSVDEAAQIIAAQSEALDVAMDEVDLHFSHVSAYGKLSLDNLSLASGETVKAIELTSDVEWAGKYYYYVGDYGGYTAGELAPRGSDASKVITVNTNALEDVWFACAPSSPSSIKVVVKTNSDSYTKTYTVPSGKSFKAGRIAKINIDMSDAGSSDVDESNLYKFTIVPSNFTSGSYASNNGKHSSTATCVSDASKTMTVEWTSNYVMLGNKLIQVKKSEGYIYNNTDLGTIVSVTINGTDALKTYYGTSAHPTSVTEVGNGYFTVRNASTGVTYASSIDVIFDPSGETTGGGESGDETVTVKTGAASAIGQNEATLSASYTGATSTPAEVRFEYGTSSGSLTKTAYYNDGGLVAPSGEFSVNVTGLSPSTTYYYRAVIQVGENDYYGNVKSFTTSADTSTDVVAGGWLELPAATTGSQYYNGCFGSGTSRNYSYLYDKSTYTALWSAYPLTKSHLSGSTSSSWTFNPNIEQKYQIDVRSSSYGKNYNASSYSRGHQVPNADRKSNSQQNAQLYYLTNQTPQIQNTFNGSIWSSLENAVRSLTSSTDTVYVVTGATFQTVGGNETVQYLTGASGITPSKVPIPNYYWKVLLKVKRSGSTITSASAIGYWFEHKSYSGSSYQNYAVSVDQIEQYTGFDFFVNLPDNLETSAESNSNWTTFQNF